MATHSIIRAWETPWTEKPGGLHFIRWQRVGHDRVTSFSLWSSDPRVPGHTFSNFLWKLRGAERGPRKFTELGVLGMRLTPEGCCCHCCSVTSNSLQPRGLQHARLFCPPLSPEICSDLCPLAFLIARLVKNLPAMPGDPGSIPDQENPLEKG